MSQILRNVVLITNSTDVAHLVTPHGTACGRWDFDLEWMEYDYEFPGLWGRNVNDYSCRVRRGCDNGLRGMGQRICNECDAHVAADEYRNLFDTYQFAHIDGIDIGEYQHNHMNREEWESSRA